MPTRFVIDGQIQPASYFHDLFVHPELRQSGQAFFLSMRMYRMCEEASPNFAALVWTNEINIKMQQARKYHQLWTDRYAKLLRADAQIDKLAARAPALGLAAPVGKPLAAALLRGADRVLGAALGRGRRIEQIEGFDGRFDDLAARMRPTIGISPDKSAAYLRWKYTARPQLEPAIFAATDDSGALAGFAVAAVPDSVYGESYLLELVADPEDERTLSALITRAADHCRDQGALLLQAVATDPRYQRVLRRLLFVPRPPREPLFLAVRDRYHAPGTLEQIERWHFSFGDSEGPI